MPTFLFFKNKVKIDEMRGADEAGLEKKIKQHIGDEGGDDDVGVAGHVRTLHFLFCKFSHLISVCIKGIM